MYESSNAQQTPMNSKTINKNIALAIVLLGLTLPWIIGIGVKLYLQFQGKPTWTWSHLSDPTILFLMIHANFWFALPYLGLASLSRQIFQRRLPFFNQFNPWVNWLMIFSGLLWGTVASVRLLLKIFWVFDPRILVFPFLISFYYVGYMFLGLGFGWIVALAISAFRKQ